MAGVLVTAFVGALKSADQVFNPVETILHRSMNRLVEAPMFDAKAAIRMNIVGGEGAADSE
ncbi:hypothetical protein GCM10027395_03920 [Giesbergeria sinuosa]